MHKEPFDLPNYTQAPNIIFDNYMSYLSGAQLKCLLYICRKTLGYHQRDTFISIKEFMIKTNLSKQGIFNSIKFLEDEGFIKVERGNNKNKYTFILKKILDESFDDPIKNNEKENKLNKSFGSQLDKNQLVNSNDMVNSVDMGSQLSRPLVVNSVDQVVNSVDQFTEELKKPIKETNINKTYKNIKDSATPIRKTDSGESGLVSFKEKDIKQKRPSSNLQKPDSDESVLVSSVKEKKELPNESASREEAQKINVAKKIADYLTTPTSKTDYRGIMACINKYGMERVKTAMKVYRQEISKIDADPNRPAVKTPGGYFYRLLESNKAPENDDFATNQMTANLYSKRYPSFLEAMQNYLKIRSNLITEELSYNVPIQTFNNQLGKFIEMCLGDLG